MIGQKVLLDKTFSLYSEDVMPDCYLKLLTFCLVLLPGSSADILLDDSCSCSYMKHFEYNCNKYYECAPPYLWLRNCPDGLHFDEASKQCVYPNQSSCQAVDACPSQCGLEGDNCFSETCMRFEDTKPYGNCR